MINTIFLNGSPKKRKAVSEKLIGILKENFDENIKTETIYLYESELDEEIFDKIYYSERVIISLPLYVDSLPAGVLEFFQGCVDYSKEVKTDKPEFYFIINCGFMEDRQNDTAIKILEKYSEKLGFEYKGGLSVGAGAMILNSNKEYLVREKMEAFAKRILGDYEQPIEDCTERSDKEQNADAFEEFAEEGEESVILRVNIDIPRFLFKAKSDKIWIDAAARKGLKKRDLNRKYYM